MTRRMKPLTWAEHQEMDRLKAKGRLTAVEQKTLDGLVTRWKVAGDVMPKVLADLFSF
jgi:hypothetical protein